MNYNIQAGLVFGESQVWHSNSSFYDTFDPNRDATVEGRTAHPTDEDIRFSNTVEIVYESTTARNVNVIQR